MLPIWLDPDHCRLQLQLVLEFVLISRYEIIYVYLMPVSGKKCCLLLTKYPRDSNACHTSFRAMEA